jgi:hypothetical protein
MFSKDSRKWIGPLSPSLSGSEDLHGRRCRREGDHATYLRWLHDGWGGVAIAPVPDRP